MKIEKDSQEWRKLTFAQRTSRAEIDIWQIPELSKKFRKNVSMAAEASLSNACRMHCTEPRLISSSDISVRFRFNETPDGEFWGKLVTEQRGNLVKDILTAAFDIKHGDFLEFNFRRVIHDLPSWKLVSALEIMFQTPGMPEDLAKKIEKELECSPYHLDVSAEPVIIVQHRKNEST